MNQNAQKRKVDGWNWEKPNGYKPVNGCAEVAWRDDVVKIRSTRSPRRSVALTFEEWLSLIEAIKAGQFDFLGYKNGT